MGLLTTGRPLSWNEIVPLRNILQSYAVKQLIQVFEKCKDRHGDHFMWGDEVELTLVRFDHVNKTVQLLLVADQLLPRLVDSNQLIDDEACRIAWHPEACNFVVEGVPSAPYGYLPSHCNTIEANMKLRREQVQRLLEEQSDSDYVLNLAAFPQYGQGAFYHPYAPFDYTHMVEKSLCFPDVLISPIHPRTKSLATNCNARRQAKASVDIPIFRDDQTPRPFRDRFFEDHANLIDDHIHLDSSSAGWGCCCLQVTFQSQSLAESLRLYDQLLPLTGIMLALSAACPIWRGYLADIDCRWNVLSAACDDRTSEERQQSSSVSRYNTTPFYLSDEHDHLNDLQLTLNTEVVSTLVSQGMSPTLARHFGHLFAYDPLVIIEEQVHPKDDSSSYHFENLNSLVWHSLRFKPPPLDDDQMGWRVEFRPMDIQITDFENAALVVFIALLTRAILTYNLDLSIPISQVKENMERAHHRDSVRKEKFYFRASSEIRLMSINEIINGTDTFSGLVPLIQTYLQEREEVDADTKLSIDHYLSLISKRAAGTLLTDASWMRDFVLSHPQYQHDSIVSDHIQYDLLWKITQVANGHDSCPSLVQPRMQTHTDLHTH